MDKLIITPKTKIYDLLEAYPQVEDELIRLVPAFSKLKNPILRKTIAKVTTLQQAAMIGGVELGIIINKIRQLAGDDAVESAELSTFDETTVPDWFDEHKIVRKLDARPLLAKGEHPIEIVSKECRGLSQDEIFMLITDFVPAPLIDIMKSKGFGVWYKQQSSDSFNTYFRRQS